MKYSILANATLAIAVILVSGSAMANADLAQGGLDHLTFTPEAFEAVNGILALRRSTEVVLGWVHSHPARSWCGRCSPEKRMVCPLQRPGFFSEDDVHVHETVFPRSYSVALVVTVLEEETQTTLFGYQDGVIKQRAFIVLP